MPYTGEEPITSFFRRISSREKRKESSGIHQRKRPQPDTEANKPLASSKKPKVQQKLVLRDARKNRGNIPKTTAPLPASAESASTCRTESLNSMPRSSSAPPPPVEAVLRDGSAALAHNQREKLLPTPITTRRHETAHAPQTLLSTDLSAEKTSRCLTSLHPANFLSSTHKPRVSTDSLPTPTTIVHRTTGAQLMAGSRELPPTLTSPDASPTELNAPNRLPPPESLSKEGLSFRTWDDGRLPSPTLSHSVPSSQSQNDGFEPDDSITPHAGKRLEWSTGQQLPLFLEPRLPDHALRDVSTKPPSAETSGIEDSDGHQYVHSSQSQHMLPFHVSPRKNRGKTGYLSSSSPLLDDATLSYIEEIIPSSQSQTEAELDTSKRTSDHCPLIRLGAITTESSWSSDVGWYTSAPKAMQLTSDERWSSYENVNKYLDTGLNAGQLLADGDPGSATEDESENGNDASFPDGTVRRLSSGIEQLGVLTHFTSIDAQEIADYASSLPAAVKEFQDMFGEGVGSYPEDFPMSLR